MRRRQAPRGEKRDARACSACMTPRVNPHRPGSGIGGGGDVTEADLWEGGPSQQSAFPAGGLPPGSYGERRAITARTPQTLYPGPDWPARTPPDSGCARRCSAQPRLMRRLQSRDRGAMLTSPYQVKGSGAKRIRSSCSRHPRLKSKKFAGKKGPPEKPTGLLGRHPRPAVG